MAVCLVEQNALVGSVERVVNSRWFIWDNNDDGNDKKTASKTRSAGEDTEASNTHKKD